MGYAAWCGVGGSRNSSSRGLLRDRATHPKDVICLSGWVRFLTKPRILQVCAVDFTALHFLRPLMEGCRDAGWEVEFACAPGPGVATLERLGFRFRRFDVSRRPSPLVNGRALARLSAALRSDRPAVVHTHTPIAGLIGRLA